MGNAKQNRTTNAGSNGSIRDLFSKPLRDRFCKACGRPYVGPNEPLPVRRFNLGNAEVQVFESASFGRLKRELRVHCWNRYRDQWCSQSIFSEHDFQHLAAVIGQALRFMNEQARPKGGSRSK